MIAFTIALPRKWSRTSTHAVIVPSTAFAAETRKAAPRLCLSAAIDSGCVTTVQNWCRPSLRDAQTSAAIGRMTTTVRYIVVKPSERAAAPSLGRRRTRRRASGAACAVLARGRSSDRLLDLDHPSLVRVEPDLVGLPPAAEDLVVDPRDPRPRRILLRVLREDALHHRPEAVLREEVL